MTQFSLSECFSKQVLDNFYLLSELAQEYIIENRAPIYIGDFSDVFDSRLTPSKHSFARVKLESTRCPVLLRERIKYGFE